MKKILYWVPVYTPYRSLPFPSQEQIDNVINEILIILQQENCSDIYHIGQMILPLLGFLENNPDKRALVRQLIEQKKLFIGPFFIQFNAGHTSGESLIRNLLIGHQKGRQIGEVLKGNYFRSLRGRNSQAPQILTGFNIDALLTDYDIQLTEKKAGEFIWEGGDGSKVLVGRAAFITPETLTVSKTRIKEILQKYFDESTNMIIVYQFNDRKGLDTMSMQYEKLASAFKAEIKIESIPECIWNIKDTIDQRELNSFKGEICLETADENAETQFDYFLKHSVDIGIINHRLENFLQYMVEPWSLLINYLKQNATPIAVEKIWSDYLKNQVFTCLVDKQPGKFVQTLYTELNHLMTETTDQIKGIIASIVSDIHIEKSPKECYYFTVINPLPYSRSEVVEIVIEMPFTVDRNSIAVHEVDGREIPFRILYKEEGALFKFDGKDTAKYHCAIDLMNFPGMGWKTYQVELYDKPKPFQAPPISPENNILENDFLRVEINDNGTLEVFAKETGEFFAEVAYFIDEVDLGKYRAEDKTATHIPLTTRKLHPQIKLLYNSPLAAAYRIEYFWEIPGSFNWTHFRRSSKHEWIKIIEIVTLDRLARQVDLKLEINDRAFDHMIKICFPIGFVPDNTYTDGFFSVEPRSFVAKSNPRCRMLTMGNFVGVSNEQGGFAILNDGINEYQLTKGKHNALTMTLVRDFQIVRSENSDGQGALRNEKTEIHLAFYPHLADWETGTILTEAVMFNNPLILRQLSQTGGALPARMQFLKVNPDTLLYSAFKSTADGQGAILRLYNPTPNMIDGEIKTCLPIKAARYLTLEEHVIAPIDVTDPNRLEIKVFSKKIVVIKIVFDQNK